MLAAGSFLGACAIYSLGDLPSAQDQPDGSGGAAGAVVKCEAQPACGDSSADALADAHNDASIVDVQLEAMSDRAIAQDGPPMSFLTTRQVAPLVTSFLSGEGDIDWAHWGYLTAADYNHKANRTALITSKVIGTHVPTRYTNDATTFTWNDGTPTAVGTTRAGIMLSAVGDGFQLTTPADTKELRTIRVFVGASAAEAKVDARLSDDSTFPNIDTVTASTENPVFWIAVVTYRSAKPGVDFVLKYTLTTAYTVNSTITWKAATLQVATPDMLQ